MNNKRANCVNVSIFTLKTSLTFLLSKKSNEEKFVKMVIAFFNKVK